VAEFVATAVFTVIGSVGTPGPAVNGLGERHCPAHGHPTRLLPRNAPPPAMLYTTPPPLGCLWGAGVIPIIYAVGNASGAHLNPAVTLMLWIVGQIRAAKALGYMVAQVGRGEGGGTMRSSSDPAR
jgi:glycerol uptake facilitator-like aquaporin